MKLEEEKEKLLQTTKYSNTNRGQQQKTKNNNDNDNGDDDRENRNRKHINNKQFVNVLKKTLLMIILLNVT